MNIRNQITVIACIGILAFTAGCNSNQMQNTGSTNVSQEVKVNKDAETAKTSSESVKMVFFVPTEDGSGVKQQSVDIAADKVTPKAALLAMLKADRQQKYPIFDKAIKINSVTVKDGVASVEVNKAFVDGKGGDLTVKLQMAAIVNTLTSFDNINVVLFVCDGKKVPIVGAFDTKSPVKRMEQLIKK